jgi:hypothetical protein
VKPGIESKPEVAAENRQEQMEVQAERLKAARAAGRAGKRAKHHERGFVSAAVMAAGFFLQENRYSAELAREFLTYLNLDKSRAEAAGLGDFELGRITKAGAWP